MTEQELREKIVKIIYDWMGYAATHNHLDGAIMYNLYNAQELADALIAAGLTFEPMTFRIVENKPYAYTAGELANWKEDQDRIAKLLHRMEVAEKPLLDKLGLKIATALDYFEDKDFKMAETKVDEAYDLWRTLHIRTLQYIKDLEAANDELTRKTREQEEQLKEICDRTAKFLSLEQIEKKFIDWTIPFLKTHIASCKEEWFGIDCIAKAIWESIKVDYATAITVDETNAGLRARLDKAVELKKPYLDIDHYGGLYLVCYDKVVRKIESYDEQKAAEKRLAELGGEK